MAIKQTILMYLIGVVSAIVVLLSLIKDTFFYGFREVFGKPTFQRPSEVLEDPALGTHGYLRLPNGVRIHYVASGPEDKPLMLFLHGFPDFWFSWRHQIKEFQKDFRVVAIDQRGYGDSDKPLGIYSYTVENLITDVRHVILGLGRESCVLVSHDWGGLVAWTFAAKFPDMVDRLVVLNCPSMPIFKKVLDTDSEQFKRASYMYFFQMPYIPELYLRSRNLIFIDMLAGKIPNPKTNTFNLKKPMTDEEVQAYKYTFSQPDALTYPLNWYRAEFRNGFSTDHSLNYPMPCLLIWGMKDTALGPILPEVMEKDCPGLVVKRCDDAGHFIQFEEPEFVNATIRQWLEEKA